MLGHAVCLALREYGYEYQGYTSIGGNILSPGLLYEIRDMHKPDVVINCAGKPNGGEIHLVNHLGPHIIADVFRNSRIFHVSTDCVYDHTKEGYHTVRDLAEPQSDYGRAKLQGEVGLPHVTNFRTSFIGFKHGLMNWFLHSQGEVEGYANAWWSGSTVDEVADELVCLIRSPKINLNNIENLATPMAISKYDLLMMLAPMNTKVNIVRNEKFHCNRAMKPTIVIEPVETALSRMRLNMSAPRA